MYNQHAIDGCYGIGPWCIVVFCLFRLFFQIFFLSGSQLYVKNFYSHSGTSIYPPTFPNTHRQISSLRFLSCYVHSSHLPGHRGRSRAGDKRRVSIEGATKPRRRTPSGLFNKNTYCIFVQAPRGCAHACHMSVCSDCFPPVFLCNASVEWDVGERGEGRWGASIE